jgi:hypothetical protein
MTPDTKQAAEKDEKAAAEKDGPRYRRNPPKHLPAGATFTPTHLVVKDEKTGKWLNRRLTAVNHERRERKASGLSGKQLKKARARAMKEAEKANPEGV